jgi:exodeoxyribonuclease-3
MQETKLADADAPVMAFAMAGYQLVHHGEGAGTASRSRRDGLAIGDVVTNFGDGPVRDSGPAARAEQSEDDFDPFDEARMLARRRRDARREPVRAERRGRRVAVLRGKLRWFERLARWISDELDSASRLSVATQRRPDDIDVWDTPAVHGGTHVSEPERAAFRALSTGAGRRYRLRHDEPGRFTWWDYRAGNFHKNFGMRIDHLLVRAGRRAVVDAEIDREARKGPPVPSDHAPL